MHMATDLPERALMALQKLYAYARRKMQDELCVKSNAEMFVGHNMGDVLPVVWTTILSLCLQPCKTLKK